MAHPCYDAAATARHDLGRAIALNLRWLPAAASDAELLDALRDDLLRTRTSRAGVEDAPTLWARLRPALAELGSDPDLQSVDSAMLTIADLAEKLRAGAASRAELDTARVAAIRVSDALASLAKRLKEL